MKIKKVERYTAEFEQGAIVEITKTILPKNNLEEKIYLKISSKGQKYLLYLYTFDIPSEKFEQLLKFGGDYNTIKVELGEEESESDKVSVYRIYRFV